VRVGGQWERGGRYEKTWGRSRWGELKRERGGREDSEEGREGMQRREWRESGEW
jgi:hypothetical protein